MKLSVKILQIILKLLSKVPLSVSRRAGRALGRMLMRLDKKHRNIVFDNLRFSFPDKDAAWIDGIAKKCFEHLGMIICELPYLAAAPVEKLISLTRVHGMERIQTSFTGPNKKSIFALTGHIGNWEWCNVLMGALGARANIIARPLDNKTLDIVVNNWRQRTGQKVISKMVSARRLLPLLKAGQSMATLLDQNMDWYDGTWVEFFGRPACTNHGLALLAMYTKAPVFSLHCFRADDGCFDIYLGEQIPLSLSGDRTKDVWQNTQNFTKILEDIIRQKPEQWLWMHQRWKTKNFCPWPRNNGHA